MSLVKKAMGSRCSIRPMRQRNWIVRHQRRIAIFLIVTSTIVSIVGCGPKTRDPLSPRERAWLTAHDGQIRLGPDPAAPPLDFFDEAGNYRGLTADYVRLIEQKLGFRFKIVRMPSWDAALQSARSGEIDVVCAAKRTTERDKYLLFTKPFIHIPEVIVTRKEWDTTVSMEDLRGKKVTMVEGYAVLEIVETQYPWLDIETSENDLDGLLKVSFNRSDAMIIDLTMAAYLIEKKGIGNLRVAGYSDIIIDLGFASRKDLPILNSILEKGLALVTPEERQSIFNKWIHLGLKPFYKTKSFWLVLAVILSIPIIIILGILAWSRSLKHQVAQRTARLNESLGQLRESETRFRTLVENIPGVFYRCACDKDWTIDFISPEVEALTGYPPSDFVQNQVRSLASIVHPDDAQTVEEVVHQAVAKKTKFTVEYRVMTSRGEPCWVFEKGQGYYDESGQLVCLEGVIVDVTERKRAEEALRVSEEKLARLEKMESLGLMAGGIAHDLNNILSGIVSYPELLLLDLPEESPLTKPLKLILDSGLRASDIVADLLTIARGAAAVKEVTNLNSIIEEYLKSAEHKAIVAKNSAIDFKVTLEADPLQLRCSATHIKKCLMNLVINAVEAIKGTGTITISSANRYLEKTLKGYSYINKGEYVVVSVSNDGPQIPSKDLARIFEPFYTKKMNAQSGTGLGLAVVWNTVQNHDGYTEVRSDQNQTVFELYFPVTREAPAGVAEEIPLEEYLGGGEKILVVDDEPVQTEIASAMLARLRYNVEAVSSGEEAIEYLQHHPVDLVVLDMIMPRGISGCETYEKIIQIHPGQKAIIASGFSESEDVKRAQRLGAGRYIKKPYTLKTIGLAVRQELDLSRSPR